MLPHHHHPAEGVAAPTKQIIYPHNTWWMISGRAACVTTWKAWRITAAHALCLGTNTRRAARKETPPLRRICISFDSQPGQPGCEHLGLSCVISSYSFLQTKKVRCELCADTKRFWLMKFMKSIMDVLICCFLPQRKPSLSLFIFYFFASVHWSGWDFNQANIYLCCIRRKESKEMSWRKMNESN